MLYNFKNTGTEPRQIIKAFTLIELLVVIAIIAILAAILFPVFARAKVAAKAATSLSNISQITKSMLMYSNDYDDMFVIGGQWGSQDSDASQIYGSSAAYMPWTGLIQSYIKNKQILSSPLPGPTTPFYANSINNCGSESQCIQLYSTYGYNTANLSPSYVIDPADRSMRGLSQTAAEKPADLVLLTEIWSRNRSNYTVFAAGPYTHFISYADACPPVMRVYQPAYPATVGQYAPNNWGAFAGTLGTTNFPIEEEGRFTAGVAFRFMNQTPVAFADGHVKKLTVSQLAAGTDYVYGVTKRNPGANILFNGKYLWDPRGL